MALLEPGAKHIKDVIKVESTMLEVVTCVVCRRLGVGYGIVSALYFLETIFVTTFVRVMLAGQLAIGSFDFVGCGAGAHAQSLIRILHVLDQHSSYTALACYAIIFWRVFPAQVCLPAFYGP